MSSRDCTNKCKSVQHGDLITAALSKRGVSDVDLCAYLQQLCYCCETVKDSFGRTALQVAASCGRYAVVKWLVEVKKANINAKDDESGYTALHRSIFYGQIDVAVFLISQGANIGLTDLNGLTTLEHAVKDTIEHSEIYGIYNARTLAEIKEGEVYVWGSNANYTLGPQQARQLPELLDVFHKQWTDFKVRQVCLGKFHCILVACTGEVFACGHGQGGRLGLATEKTVVTPELLHFKGHPHIIPFRCKQASIGRDHSLFLSTCGQVWVCGLNDHKVLGIQPPPGQLLTPTKLPMFPKDIEGIAAARYHSLAWNPECIYTWGLNAGQLGHNQTNEKYIIRPKSVALPPLRNGKIVAVNVSDGATAFATSTGDIYVLHEYQCRKIASRQLNIVSISVIGGTLNNKLEESLSGNKKHELKVAAVSNAGNIYLWQESDPQFLRCILALQRSLTVLQLVLNQTNILLITDEGEAFEATIKSRKKIEGQRIWLKNCFHRFLDQNDCLILKLHRIPRIYRAIAIYSDVEGNNYAAIQADPKGFQEMNLHIPDSTMREDMGNLLRETDFHDIVFKISDQLFPAHKYVIFSNSQKLMELSSSNTDKHLEIPNIRPEIFNQFLMYCYTGKCALNQYGICPKELLRPSENNHDVDGSNKKTTENVKDPVRLLQETAKRFGMKRLQKEVDNFLYDTGYIRSKSPYVNPAVTYDRDFLPQLHDVVIITKEGKRIPAHKCILAARLEYFKSLFLRWSEECRVQEVKLEFPYSVVQHVIKFLYMDEIECSEDMDHIFNLLIVADHLFITRLREFCELYLCKHITLKNVSQVLTFSCIYNASELKDWCLKFISLNMPTILESRCLETVDEEILHDVKKFYCEYFKRMQHRIITPFSFAPSDEEVAEAGVNCSISFEPSDGENEKTPNKPQKRRSRNRKTSSSDTKVENVINLELTENKTIDEERLLKDHSNIDRDVPLTVTQRRLKAISCAQEKLSDEENHYTKLSSHVEPISLDGFPELGPANQGKGAGKVGKADFRQKIRKLSQKQRKRLSSSESSVNGDIPVPKPSESPKSPWKLNTEPASPVGSPKSDMHSIILDEKRQRENFVKMKTKKLVFTQLEDKAIDDLYKFYNVENLFDEILNISRVEVDIVATPVWVTKSNCK